ncbi:MAG: UPF0280 family protein [Actinomycetota bacterium]|nr:UPF0280 family protein [Actinomycetota bacterium]
MSYEPRTYRRTVSPAGLVCFDVRVKETDLQICASEDLSDLAEDLVARSRWEIEEFIRGHPYFAETFAPIDVPEDAPEIIVRMAQAARVASVGPMAAVAGAIAEYVARGLSERSPNVIVENGGDIFVMGDCDRTVALWAGEQGIQSVGVVVPAGLQPIAVCTSSGRIGHSTSFGQADAVTVLARNACLADAVATALANRVHTPDDIEAAIEAARGLLGVLGVIATIDGHIGAWGNVRLVSLAG